MSRKSRATSGKGRLAFERVRYRIACGALGAGRFDRGDLEQDIRGQLSEVLLARDQHAVLRIEGRVGVLDQQGASALDAHRDPHALGLGKIEAGEAVNEQIDPARKHHWLMTGRERVLCDAHAAGAQLAEVLLQARWH